MPTPRDFMKHGLTQCQHGQLARQCLLCEQAAEIEWQRCKIEWMRAEIEQLRTETKALRQALRNLMDIAEYWFIKGAERDMSESEYRNWRSMSYGSEAYQDAKQAALAAKEE